MVPGDYDPLLAKLIAWGADRPAAIARLRRALQEFAAAGIKTNIALFRAILDNPEFMRNDVHTRWLDQRLDGRPDGQLDSLRVSRAGPQSSTESSAEIPSEVVDAAAVAAALWHCRQTSTSQGTPPETAPQPAVSRWKIEGRREQLARATGSATI